MVLFNPAEAGLEASMACTLNSSNAAPHWTLSCWLRLLGLKQSLTRLLW
jgi:hypothetical protein